MSSVAKNAVQGQRRLLKHFAELLNRHEKYSSQNEGRAQFATTSGHGAHHNVHEALSYSSPNSIRQDRDPVVLLESNLYCHQLAGLWWERQLEECQP